jgi:dethiobiotin synthetase
MRGVFVTGTGTGVGKTIFSAGLAWALGKKGVGVGVMKPFATSQSIYSKKYRSADVAMLAKGAGTSESDAELNPVFYRLAAAPMMAAELLNQPPPDLNKVLSMLRALAARHEFMIVEGIGGIAVPVTPTHSVADFIKLTGLPVIIVTSPFLGTINHTLLTISACAQHGLRVFGVAVNMMPRRPNIVEEKIPETLARISRLPVVGIIPRLSSPSPATVGKIILKEFDLDRLLAL